MITRHYWLLVVGALSLPTMAKPSLAPDTETVTALTNAEIHISATEKRNNATLLISGNKVIDVINNDAIPTDAHIIDMQGYVLLPGFIDPFTEYGIEFNYTYPDINGPVYSVNTLGGQAPNTAVHAQQKWVQHFSPNPTTAKNWQQNGFTSVQTAKHDGLFQGQSSVVSLAQKPANEAIINAYSNPLLSFNKGSSPMDYPESLMGAIALIRQTFSDSLWLKDNRNKPNFGQQALAPAFNSAWQAIAAQWQQDWIFNGGDLNNVLRAGALLRQQQLSGILIASGREYARLNEIKALNYPFIVPLNFPAAPKVEDADIALDTSLAQLRHWQSAPSNPAQLASANIPFALTQHGLEPQEFWPRVQLAVAKGLAPSTALAALTSVPASMIGIDDKAGKLAAGYFADIVVAKGDIFTDGHIVGVYLQGQANFSELTPTQANLAGEYQLEFGDHSLVLALDPQTLANSSLQVAEHNIGLIAPTLDNQRLSFAVALDDTRDDVSRFILWFDHSGVHGRVYNADGNPTPVGGTRIAPQASPSEAAKTLTDDPLTITFPNGAYGRAQLPSSEKLHIQGATLWTSEQSGILPETDILIENGKISAIGKQLTTPKGFTLLPAQGLHVTAGIVDEHSHIAVNGGVNEGTNSVTSEVRIGDVLNPDSLNIYQSLAGGVTTTQLLHGSANPIGGQAQLIKLRWGESANNLKFIGAPGAIKFALGENVKQSHWGDEYVTRFPQTRMGVKTVMVDAFDAAKQYQQQQYAWQQASNRSKNSTIAPRIDYRLQAINEVANGKRDVHIHSYVQSEILMFLSLAKTYGFNVSAFTHVLEGYKVADELAAAGAGASTFSDWWAYKFEVYDAIPQNACLLNDKGVVTSLNSDDYSMQRRLNQEAAKSIMYCSMSDIDAWNMVTINPAKQLGVDHMVGSLKVGKHADIVLWSDYPLSVYAKTQTVWIDGRRYFDRQQNQQMEHEIITEKAKLIQQVLQSDTKRRDGDAEIINIEPEWHCDSHYQHAKAQQLFNGDHR
ncbi:amidohydrolase family protein [Shewanella sp. NIFS-20-20]|uniref:amidohydrolase family protein n=1 Tax=Shewanella sp. NIFS-20-20 TaxID=2853806 RepID=UPI001C47478A|nr:amidohydrolase family protein [Shewanella sp. NIFS-20-20]MBV7316229.1 amidohydrolase family protein [Shewanella sp. NIFS-20-20]